MIVTFTDLDGTLLDHETYSYDAAKPALGRLRESGIPLVFCTSKTRAEVEVWRDQLEIRDPFIIENGGALYVPRGYFPLNFRAPAGRDGYDVFEFGDSYDSLVAILHSASRESRCRVLGFSDMTAEEIGSRCGIPVEKARLARQREFDEPFEILDPEAEASLLSCIKSHKRRWTRGGRFHHILGVNDKAHCVRLLTHFYERAFGAVTTVGLGDGPNDVSFLNAVTIPIVMQSPMSSRLQAAVRRARVTDSAGPEGWNLALMDALRECQVPPRRPRMQAAVTNAATQTSLPC